MDNDTILVFSGEPSTRDREPRKLKVKELSTNVNLFIKQVNSILDKTPSELGDFKFMEFEIYAEITAKGMLAVLGTGGEAGSTGGLKFVFRR